MMFKHWAYIKTESGIWWQGYGPADPLFYQVRNPIGKWVQV
jgi:hypothetical protein